MKHLIEEDEFIPAWDVSEDSSYLRWHLTSNHRGTFRFDDTDTLVSMEIYPNAPFSMAEVIGLYGEPEAIRTRLENTNSANTLVQMYFYFPDIGMIVDSHFESTAVREFVIPQDLLGYGYKILDSSQGLEEIVSRDHNLTLGERSTYMDELILGWPGFGAVLTSRDGESGYIDPMIAVTPTPR